MPALPSVVSDFLSASANGAAPAVTSAASTAQKGKDGFQALLDIGERPAAKPVEKTAQPRKDGRDTQAVAADAPQRPANDDLPKQKNTDAAEPAPKEAPAADNPRPAPRAKRTEPKDTDASDAAPKEPAAVTDTAPEQPAADAPVADGQATAQQQSAEALAAALLAAPAADASAPQIAGVPQITETAGANSQATAPSQVAGQQKNIADELTALLDTLRASYPLEDGRPLAANTGGNPLLTALRAQIKEASALLEAYEEKGADQDALAQKIKSVTADIHRLIDRIGAPVAQTPAQSAVETLAAAAAIAKPAHLADAPKTDNAPAPGQQAATPAAQKLDTILAAAAVSDQPSADTRSGGNNAGTGQNLPQNVAGVRAAQPEHQAAKTNASSFAQTLTRSASRPVVEQIVFHIRTAQTDGSSRIRIQLDPEELGKLDIKLHVGADGRTGVSITADNRQTLEMLQRDTRGLEQALADAGLAADSGNLNFNLRGGQQQGQDGSQAAQSYRKSMPEEDEPMTAALTRSYVVNLAEGLDITI